MTVLLDAPAAKSRSLALVVVTAPLLIAADEPMADAVTSTGFTLLRPEYSCRYTIPNELIAVPKVAVTVFDPPAMLFA